MLAVSVDIEDWYHLPTITGSSFSRYGSVEEFFQRWEGRFDYLSQPTHRVLDLLDGLEVKATFFVVADVVDHYPGLVNEIVDCGHEIACHGLHHACIIDPRTKKSTISQERFEIRMREAKQKLEKVSGQEIIGFRAPNAYIAGWMLDSLERIGFKYDSSVCVNSIYNKCDRRPEEAVVGPYYPKKGTLQRGEEERILEIPWPTFSLFGVRLPAAGGPFLRFFGANYIKLGLKESLMRGDTVFYFHPIDISSEKFPSGFSRKRPFYWSIKGGCVEKRIKYLLTTIDAELGTCREIWERWQDG